MKKLSHVLRIYYNCEFNAMIVLKQVAIYGMRF